MEALAAVGLASNIVSFIDFGFKAARQCNEIMKNGSTAEYNSIDIAAKALSEQCIDIHARLSESQTSSTGKNEPLDRLATDCLASSMALQDVLGLFRYSEHDELSWGRRLKLSLVGLRKQGQVEKLEQQLNRSRKALDSAVLHGLATKYDLQTAISSGEFHAQDEAVKSTTRELAAGRTTYADLVRAESRATRLHITSEAEKLLSRLASNEQVQRFVDSLGFPDMSTRFETVEPAHSRTFDWIFDSKQNATPSWSSFPDWLSGGASLYWINGVAGAGKSTLMSYICHDDRTSQLLQQWQVDGQLAMLHFFFWRPGSKRQHSCCGMLRSLAYQALSRFATLRQYVATSYLPQPGQDFVPAWSEFNLIKLLKLIFSQDNTPLRVCLFIDGADELDESYDNLMSTVKSICGAPNVKACVASRPLAQFAQAFKDDPKLRLQDLTRQDLQNYVESSLLPLASEHHICMDHIVREILENASGIFLWVKLVVEDIKAAIIEGNSAREIDARLSLMPKELDQLYSHLLAQIDRAYRKEAFCYFKVLLRCRELKLTYFQCLYCFAILQEPVRDFGKLFTLQNLTAFWSRDLLFAMKNAPQRILSRTRGLLQPVNPDVFNAFGASHADSSSAHATEVITEVALVTQVRVIHRSFFEHLERLDERDAEFQELTRELDSFSAILEAQVVLRAHIVITQGFAFDWGASEALAHIYSYTKDVLKHPMNLYMMYRLLEMALTHNGTYNEALIKTTGSIAEHCTSWENEEWEDSSHFRQDAHAFETGARSITHDWIGHAAAFGFCKPLEVALNGQITGKDQRKLFKTIMMPDIPFDWDQYRHTKRNETFRRRIGAVRCLVNGGLQIDVPFADEDEDVVSRSLGYVERDVEEMMSVAHRESQKTKTMSPLWIDGLSTPLKYTSAFAIFTTRVWAIHYHLWVYRFTSNLRHFEVQPVVEEIKLAVDAFLQHGADPSALTRVQLFSPSELLGGAKGLVMVTLPISHILTRILPLTSQEKSSLEANSSEAPYQFELKVFKGPLFKNFQRVSGGVCVGWHEIIENAAKSSGQWRDDVQSIAEILQQCSQSYVRDEDSSYESRFGSIKVKNFESKVKEMRRDIIRGSRWAFKPRLLEAQLLHGREIDDELHSTRARDLRLEKSPIPMSEQ